MTLKLVDRMLLKMSQIFQILTLVLVPRTYVCKLLHSMTVLIPGVMKYRQESQLAPLSLNLLYTKRIFQDCIYLSPSFFFTLWKTRGVRSEMFPTSCLLLWTEIHQLLCFFLLSPKVILTCHYRLQIGTLVRKNLINTHISGCWFQI